MRRLPHTVLTFFLFSLISSQEGFCQSVITKWRDGKKGAISITYDDGIITQFKEVIPIMNRLHFPGTFFIVTGSIKGSRYQPKFIGRPIAKIVEGTKTIATNKDNFFERASAIRFIGYKGTAPLFYKAGSFYEQGKLQQAYQTIDSGYALALAGALPPGIDTTYEEGLSAENTWSDFKKYAEEGHEFACHSLSHPFMAILDTVNMYYELQRCREDIRSHLGKQYTFSAEVPFGTEDARVMKYVLASNLFPALRNKMPEPYMQEINRGYKTQPGASEKQYVQWQRGPLSNTPMSVMKSWIDTLSAHDNIWLVLVFHGIDNIGWEPLKHEQLAAYFQYIKDQQENVWVATFQDVTKYMRERMAATIREEKTKNGILILLKHSLDRSLYDLPLTIKTYVPSSWRSVSKKQNGSTKTLQLSSDEKGKFVMFQALPNSGNITLSR